MPALPNTPAVQLGYDGGIVASAQIGQMYDAQFVQTGAITHYWRLELSPGTVVFIPAYQGTIK
jgi:hypothetical protein